MKSNLFFLLLTILLRTEFFVLDSTLSCNPCLTEIVNSEWVLEEKIQIDYFKAVYEKYTEIPNSNLNIAIRFSKTFLNCRQPLFYPQRLHLSEGHINVSPHTYLSNIPHQNGDDEDPMFLLG